MRTVRLTGSDIDGDRISCTIAQLAIVFAELADRDGIQDLVWYGADMDPALGDLEPFAGGVPVKVGSVGDVIALLRKLSFPQIDWGVFMALSTADRFDPRHPISAEGPAGKRFAGSDVEVIAIDDTYIEIIADRADIIEGLREQFGGNIVDP